MSYLVREKAGFENSKCFSTKSFQTFQDSALHCANCKMIKEEMEGQVAQLKDKAHQSFMQVLQIQQLHDEELTIMREEFQERQRHYISEIDQLKSDKNHLCAEMLLLEKNTKRHSCDFGAKELVIENIDAILCEEGDLSYLDESELIQFKDLINIRNGNDYVANLRREIYKDIKFVSNNKTQIEKLFILIRQLKEENTALHQKIEELNRKVALTQNQIKSAKNASEASTKEIKFLSDQIKRLGNDKLRLQKKVGEMERGYNSPNNRPKVEANDNMILGGKYQSPNSQKSVLDHQKSISVLEESKYNCSEISEMRRQVNELNYAKFMGPEEVEVIDHNFKKKSGENKIRVS